MVLACALLVKPERATASAAPLLLDEPAALASLEESGYSFDTVLRASQRAVLFATIAGDMAEMTQGDPKESPRRPFQVRWLTAGHFELTGVVNRFDRAMFEGAPGGAC